MSPYGSESLWSFIKSEIFNMCLWAIFLAPLAYLLDQYLQYLINNP